MVPPASRTIGESASDNDPKLAWTHGFSDTSLRGRTSHRSEQVRAVYGVPRHGYDPCSRSKGPSQQMFPVELTRARIAHFSYEFPLCVRSISCVCREAWVESSWYVLQVPPRDAPAS